MGLSKRASGLGGGNTSGTGTEKPRTIEDCSLLSNSTDFSAAPEAGLYRRDWGRMHMLSAIGG